MDLDLDTPPYGMAIPQGVAGVATAEAAADVAHVEVSEVEALREAGFELTAPVAEATLEAEELFEQALEVAAPLIEAALEFEQPMLAEVEAPVVAAEVEPVVVAQAEPEAALESAPEIDVVSEIEVAPAIEAVAAAEVAELANVAAVADVVSIEVGRTAAQSPLPALERFLSKVQARRAQLMAESVA